MKNLIWQRLWSCKPQPQPGRVVPAGYVRYDAKSLVLRDVVNWEVIGMERKEMSEEVIGDVGTERGGEKDLSLNLGLGYPIGEGEGEAVSYTSNRIQSWYIRMKAYA